MKATVEVTSTTEPTFNVVKPGTMFKAPVTERGHDKITGYYVKVAVEFSEEERAIITTYNLWETPVYSEMVTPGEGLIREADKILRKNPNANVSMLTDARELPVTIKLFADGQGGKSFTSPIEAHNYRHTLKTEYLPSIKKLLDTCTTLLSEPETLEF